MNSDLCPRPVLGCYFGRVWNTDSQHGIRRGSDSWRRTPSTYLGSTNGTVICPAIVKHHRRYQRRRCEIWDHAATSRRSKTSSRSGDLRSVEKSVPGPRDHTRAVRSARTTHVFVSRRDGKMRVLWARSPGHCANHTLERELGSPRHVDDHVLRSYRTRARLF
jgi:hypothetical protein